MNKSHSAGISLDMSELRAGLFREYQVLNDRHSVLNAEDGFRRALTGSRRDLPEPVYRWYHIKESFSTTLLSHLMAELGFSPQKPVAILDPFCGAGTILVSAMRMIKQEWNIKATGIEVNPFLHFVSLAKTGSYRCNSRNFKAYYSSILNSKLPRDLPEPPELSTIRNTKVYSSETLNDLLSYRECIRECDCPNDYRNLLLLGFAGILEKVSGVRKDGRALRFVSKGEIPTVRDVLEEQWKMIAEDIDNNDLNAVSPAPVTAVLGDGRVPSKHGIGEKSVDLIVFSPPYLNHIDYTEVYKIELWMLGFISSYEGFRALRMRTFRSHPSIKFRDDYDKMILDQNGMPYKLIANIRDLFPERERVWRERVLRGYATDMYRCLREQVKILKDDAYSICVVGNSVHGAPSNKVVIATDLLVAYLADLAGFSVEKLVTLPKKSRRLSENPFMRETMVFMRNTRASKNAATE